MLISVSASLSLVSCTLTPKTLCHQVTVALLQQGKNVSLTWASLKVVMLRTLVPKDLDMAREQVRLFMLSEGAA